MGNSSAGQRRDIRRVDAPTYSQVFCHPVHIQLIGQREMQPVGQTL
jgi:hypothetical protein